MKPLSIYLLSIEYSNHTNGVDRHIEVFMKGLRKLTNIKCIYFAFTSKPNLMFPREYHINNNCTKVYIPLPHKSNQIFHDPNLLSLYNREVCDVIKDYLVNRECRILHVHTLNMMPFALYVKSKFKCKIISHIHCIPWKYNIDWNPGKFFYQWNREYQRKYNEKKQMITIAGEWEAYNLSDHIVCVTECGKKFVEYMQEQHPNIHVIYNGIYNTFDERKIRRNTSDNGLCHILFVGGSSKTKGLLFLVEAALLIPKEIRSRMKILIAGFCERELQEWIINKCQNINITFVGQLPCKELDKLYYNVDIGVILSLHEQCSYTAIEMMMHQLPIVSTNVDGLGEMFKDGENAMLIPVVYSEKEAKVHPHIQILSQKLYSLIKNYETRKIIGRNGRVTFMKRYTIHYDTRNFRGDVSL